MRTICTTFGLIIGSSLFVGCGESGPEMAAVKGKVLLFGKPHESAIVIFEPIDGGPAGMGKTDDKGEYEIWSAGNKGAILGEHKIVVKTDLPPSEAAQALPSGASSDDPAYLAQLNGGGAAVYKKADTPKEKIPAKYNTASEMKLEVKRGANDFLLDLK